ncbi:hypothetical protein BS47DRAFT_276664 [Hydnum rufescens UP504]|uniref:Uncharacterized protein n=1 Tax=Hydnum rufescens UP504 TaxID=1448309 RepID=A0A9P6DQU4_9AGAM|nr:hypothetical protein BS47DRAFT_276664 [Hydnum rufescens UP504]
MCIKLPLYPASFFIHRSLPLITSVFDLNLTLMVSLCPRIVPISFFACALLLVPDQRVWFAPEACILFLRRRLNQSSSHDTK